MKTFFTALGTWLVTVVLYAVMGALLALLVEIEWNYLVPSLFHGPHIDFLQAYELYVLCFVLFRLPAGLSSNS